MPFFDFHLHPTLKCMFSQDTSKTSPWEKIDVKAIPWILRWCTDFSYILGSQSNFSQLIGSGCNLVCIALHAPERGMTEDAFLNKQASGTLSKYLDPAELAIMNNPNTRPYDLIIDDLQKVLLNPGRFGITDKKIVMLKKGVAYDQHDSSSVYVAFTVEGAHSLADTYDKTTINADSILSNLDDLIAKKGITPVSINLTHLEQFKFCNHAYGILFVTSEDFKPTGKEISDDGVRILKECYSRGIMVDMKHMSLGARRFLIETLREQDDIKAIAQPLVCTHAGFTGLSYKDIPDYIEYHDVKDTAYGYILWGKPKIYGGVTMTSFNPSSINLYDEDILAILESGGMIGLSLDKRILGFSEANSRPEALNDLAFEEEYISLQEKKYFLTKRGIGGKMDDENCIITQEVLEGGEVNPDAAFYHLCHFMSHILHLVKVAGDGGYSVNQALSQVCIGSDFDGMINPIWCCDSVESLSDFKNAFIRQFPFYARANRDKVKLPEGFEIHTFANQLFFENGKNFLLQRIG
ncbi:MAG: membrane dipeptidase [Bacteroidota bacterium]|nr:membrane dipeptidase [Bacteroidota bacterium]